MADYEGALGFLGKGLESFASTVGAMEDRKMKRMALEAEMKAKEEAKARQAWQDAFSIRKAGFRAPEGFDGNAKDLDPNQLEIDPEYFQMKTAQTTAFQDPFGEKAARAKKAKQEASQPVLSPGQKALDEKFAKDFADWEAGGGKATVDKNLELLNSAISDLEAPGEISGGISGLVGDQIRDVVNPEAAIVRDKIRTAIQSSLKQIMGAQFTEKEAQAMFERAYNPRLSDAENIRRAQSELQALKNMAEAKGRAGEHFRRQGTLKDFQGLIGQGLVGKEALADDVAAKRRRLEELRRKAAQ